MPVVSPGLIFLHSYRGSWKRPSLQSVKKQIRLLYIWAKFWLYRCLHKPQYQYLRMVCETKTGEFYEIRPRQMEKTNKQNFD